MARYTRLSLLSFFVLLSCLPDVMAQSASTIYTFGTFKVGSSSYSSAGSGLVADSSGNLYGVAAWGGSFNVCKLGCGTVYKLVSPGGSWGSWTQQILYTFKGSTDGCFPQGQLAIDSAGNLYGTTTGDYCSQQGTVFKLSRSAAGAWTLQTLNRGTTLYAGVTIDPAGNLYGTTSTGVVEIKKPATASGKWEAENLLSIAGTPSGRLAYYGGNLYGYTQSGGVGHGSVYELTLGSNGKWTKTDLTDFEGGVDGSGPGQDTYEPDDIGMGLSVLNANQIWGVGYGKGTCTTAGACGTVFQLVKTNGHWTRNTIYRFNGKNGAAPMSIVGTADGNHVIGTTFSGGVSGEGTVFSLSAPKTTGGAWTALTYSFVPGKNKGDFPEGNVLLDAEGLGVYTTAGPYVLDLSTLSLGAPYIASGNTGEAACVHIAYPTKSEVKLTNSCARRVDFWVCSDSEKTGTNSCSPTVDIGFYTRGYLNSKSSDIINITEFYGLSPHANVIECKSGWYPLSYFDSLGDEHLDCAQPVK